MHTTFARFVHALRCAEVEISPAETLDAFEILQLIGIRDRHLLKDAMGLAMAKSRPEKETYDACFEVFFSHLGFDEKPQRSILDRADHEAIEQAVERQAHPTLSQFVHFVLGNQQTELALAMRRLPSHDSLSTLQTLRDKSHAARQLSAEMGIPQLATAQQGADGNVASSLGYLRQYLTAAVKTHIDVTYQLAVDATGNKALLEKALESPLNQLPPAYYHEVERVITKLADKLAKKHRRPATRAKRGTLNIKRMLRESVAADGALYAVHWKQRKPNPRPVVVVCDVSNSVRQISRFFLLLMWHLRDLLPDVRAFAFSSQLGEISNLLSDRPSAQAVEEAMLRWGHGATDYGQAFVDLRAAVRQQINRQTTLIILGDGRSNYYEPHVEVLRELTRRAQRTYWLTPESAEQWEEGDCEIPRYASCCTRITTCNKIADVERFASELLN